MKKIKIFTDGSSLNNNKSDNRSGGIGVFFGINDPRNISKKLDTDKITNQVAELLACYQGILTLITSQSVNNKKIYVYTDSKYLIDSITKYAIDWEKNNWKKKKNKEISNLDLIKKIYYLYQNINIKFKHINSHQKEPKDKNSKEYKLWFGNMMADKLATDAAKGRCKSTLFI